MAKRFSEEQWQSILQLSEAVAELPPHAREAFFESKQIGPEILQQVLSVLGGDPSPAGQPDRTGDVVGHFVITGHLGRGGVGDVYSTYDTELERTVALKFLMPRSTALRGEAETVVREARTASALNHPNIVTIYEVIRSDPAVAIVMEFIEGTALRQRVTPLPIAEVLHFGKQIAWALEAADAAGIVHRDIKPENIIVRPDGSLKVLDFGLATSTAQEGFAEHEGCSPVLLAGTWRYMSPEQAKGEGLTGATDVFSLGVVLFELCTGQHPFSESSAFETLQAVLVKTPVQPSTLNRLVPPSLDSLVLNMLRQERTLRPSASQVAASEPFQRCWITADSAGISMSRRAGRL